MPQVQVIQPIQQQPKRLRVAAYARVSSKSANQLNSMSVQVEYYTDLIQKNPDWEFAGVYADEGNSGTSLKNRTGFNHLMDDCRLGLIDRILVKSSSRMARNSVDFLSAVRELKSLGVVVEFEKERCDTDSTEGELLLGMMCAVAQEESLSISKNLRWGIRKRMESGTYHTSSVPYGYKQVNYDLVPIPNQIEIVKGIFNAFLQGKSTTKIADDLNRLHPDVDKHWHHTTIERILKNEKYAGCSLYQKSYTSDDLPFKRTENNGEVLSYYAPDTHNGIMSQADFDKVQALLQRKSVGPCPRKDTAFSKMLYCAKCGSMLSRKINRSSQVTWICRTHLRCAADCSTSPIQEERIQHVFLTMHNKLIVNHAQIFTPALHDLYAAQKILDDKESQRQELNQQVHLLAKKLHNLSRLREKTCITAAQYWERRNPLERELTDVKNTISKAATNHPLLRTLAQTKQLAEHYTYLKPLTEFDEYEFKFAVNRVLVDSESCTFELKNGMKFKEIF